MAISKIKTQMVIDNYFKDECDINTSIREAFEKGFHVGVKKGISMNTSQEWIPCSKGMSEHSYTRKFWLTVKLDDDKGTVTTLIGTWGAWSGGKDSKPYDAFDCWRDVMINGGIYRFSQPIPKEKVLAWMPAPEPWEGENDEQYI